jgi:hypothetical protein
LSAIASVSAASAAETLSKRKAVIGSLE